MACEYRIKSPDGREIILPATFDLIDREDNDIKEMVTSLAELDKRPVSALTDAEHKHRESVLDNAKWTLRRSITNKISDDVIINLVDKNFYDQNKLLDSLDEKISALGGYNDIASAILDYIKKDKNNLSSLYKKLSAPITPVYFKGLEMDGVINLSNISAERELLEGRSLENAEFGFSNEIPENLNTFINGLRTNYKDSFNGNTLVASKSDYNTRAFNVDGFTFFKANDDLSLFQGLFKKVAANVNKDSLYKILEDYNNSPKFDKYGKIDLPPYDKFNVFEFFNGSLDNSTQILGIFDELLDKSDSETLKPYITKILVLAANTIDPSNTKLFKSIQTLFWQLTPDKYGSAALQEQLRQESYLNNETQVELQYKNKMLSDLLETSSVDRDKYYAESNKITGDLYKNLKENITINQDIVLFPLGPARSGYSIVTFIAPRKNGVMVYGVRKNQFGNPESFSKLFEEGKDSITYRKYEKAVSPYNKNEIVNRNETGLFVKLGEGESQDVVKSLLQKGDTINKDLLVVGVHPGVVVAKSIKTTQISEIPYSRIKTLRSAKVAEDIENAKNADPKRYIPINSSDALSAGDLFYDTDAGFYKHILYTDSENLYYWIQPENADAIVKSIPRSKVPNGLANYNNALTLEEMQLISSEVSKVGKSAATMSSFSEPTLAKDGDYFTIVDGSTIQIGKVVDHKSKKGIIFNNNTKKSDPIIYANKDLTFYTDRDISSKFALTIARVNDWNIEALSDSELTPSHKEVKYVIPSNINAADLILWPSNYANIGKYVDINFPLQDGEKDVTSVIIQLIKESGKEVPNNKLYAQTNDNEGLSKSYKRNLYSLHKINNFDKLSTDIKQELGILHPGVYFSVYTERNIDSNIYRIMEVNNGKITARLNKLSKTGKLLTFEKQFTEEELLATKSQTDTSNAINSIAQIFLQYGEKKFNIVTRAINENLTKEQVVNQKAINTLLGKMQDRFMTLGINVKQVSSSEGNFIDGQKAKIETTEVDGRARTEILLNKDSGLVNDLVHETLHVYLTLLRYSDIDMYDTILKSVLGNLPDTSNLDVTEREERFVKEVSSAVSNGVDLLVDDIKDFMIPLMTAIKVLNPDVDIDIVKAVNNPLSELNRPLRDIFNVGIDNSHPMYNLSLISTEPAMREWMTKEKITLKC